jgi:hypothetical protein
MGGKNFGQAIEARLDGDPQAMTQTEIDFRHLLQDLRAHGVTRYKRSYRGDVEIELGPDAAVTLADSPTPEAHHADDYEFGGDDEPEGPLPPLAELRQQSADLRRQQEADRSGIEVTEAE